MNISNILNHFYLRGLCTSSPERMRPKDKIIHIDKIVPDAYHGTKLGNAVKILEEGHFIQSRDATTYLGDGVYFYEGSVWHALEWCKRRFADCEHGVICATINLGKCLDLNNAEHRALMKKVAVRLSKLGVKQVTDSVVINYFATNIEKVDTIRFSHVKVAGKYGKIYQDSRIHDFSQLIICVRNQDVILNIRLIMGGS